MVDIDETFYFQAKSVLPGGVNAAARFERYFNGPFPVSRAEGPFIYGINGARYIDLCTSHGASMLGHGNPEISKAVKRVLDKGIMCSHETEEQIKLARELINMIPCAESVRFCCTGTEAALYGIRLARAITGRNVIVKFEGHFHGHGDSLCFGNWTTTNAPPEKVLQPSTEGVPGAMQRLIRVLPFNEPSAVEKLFQKEGDSIAAIILEPVNYNGGSIPPRPGFLEGLRALTRSNESLLIFDEILSCFRTNTGCMQREFGVTPDLCLMGKALGGGLPLSAVTGNRRIMETFSPVGKAMHTGTYIAHPLSVSASSAFMEVIKKPSFYPDLLKRSARLISGIRKQFSDFNLPIKVQAFGPRFSLLFGLEQDRKVTSFRDCADIDEYLAEIFYKKARNHGIYLHPGWHHGISNAHTDAVIDDTLELFQCVCKTVSRSFHNNILNAKSRDSLQPETRRRTKRC